MSTGGPGSPGYVPGGSPGDLPPMLPVSYNPTLPGSICGGEQLCDCLGSELERINQSIYYIAKILDDRLGKVCDHVDECIDKIVDAINKKYGGALKSCDECRQMAEDGMAGTLQYAMQCANACCGECEKQCQSATDNNKPCKGCNCEPCICYNGECISEDETACEEKKKPYVGWCDRTNGIVIVTKEDQPSPGPTFVPVATTDTEEVAFEEAQRYCDSYKKQTPPVIIPPITPSASAIPFCTLAAYASPTALQSISALGKQAFDPAGSAQAIAALMKLGLGEINIGSLTDIVYGIWDSFAQAPPRLAESFIPKIAGIVGCENPGFIDAANVLAAAGYINKLAGLDFSEFLTPLVYAMHAACRNRYLDPDKAMAAYLANGSTYQQLDTQWAIAGLCPDALGMYLQASKSKPIPLQLAMMRRREQISPQSYAEGMRELGFLDAGVSEGLFNLTEQRPPLTDILRFMVRDADDETPDGPVNRFNLDFAFDDKYRQQLKKWSQDQGIPEQVARYAWRSHWTIPPPTALFEFVHRLRKNPDYPDLMGDVRAALIQQDILPHWHKHYLAVSFRPMTRIDLRRAFNIGAIDDKELGEGYTQLGYDDPTVEKMVKFTKRLRDQAAVGHRAIKLWQKGLIDANEVKQRMSADGLPDDVIDRAIADSSASFESGPDATAYVRGDITRQAFIDRLTAKGVPGGQAQRIADLLSAKITDSPSLKRLVVGLITTDKARQEMKQQGLQSEVIDRLLIEATSTVDCAALVKCQQGIHRRFMLGELDADQVVNELINRGTVAEHAHILFTAWQCERQSRGKHVPAAKLCHLLAFGVIGPMDFTQRLRNLGFSAQDADLMLQDCLISINVRRLNDARRLAKEQATAARQAAALAEREQARATRLALQQRKAIQAAQRTREARDKQLLSAADKITDKCSCDLHAALSWAKDAKTRIIRDYGLSIDETLQTILLAVEEWSGPELAALDTIVNAMAETASTAGLAPPVEVNGTA